MIRRAATKSDTRFARRLSVLVVCSLALVACADAVAPSATVAPGLRQPTLSLSAGRFCNAGAMPIPGGGTLGDGPANPYPSTVAVSGLGTSIHKVTATLRNLRHQFPNDLRIVLAGPTGQTVFLMGSAGSGDDIVGQTFTFDDAAATPIPDGGVLTGGTYQPASHSTHTMTLPAPAGPYGTTFAGFVGTNPNGTWNLWAEDWGGGDVGNMEGGWCIDITTGFDFTGFFEPVDPAPTVNRVKAGSAIPMKFSLGGDQGLAIMAAGSPSSQPIGCAASAPFDALEETVTAGGSSLTYSALTDRYTYVWKSDRSWAGTCRRLTVKLVDGSEHTADFNFTK